MKLTSLIFKNFRGSRDEVALHLSDGQSFILYGDNGTGKSSFADAIEWFVTDDISHLSGEEFEKNGGFRNALSPPNGDCFVSASFTGSHANRRSLIIQKEREKSQLLDSNATEFIKLLAKERILIRNRDLISFIVQTKGNRLADISNIIGFSDVIKAKITFRKASNDVSRIIKLKDFEGQIAKEKAILVEKLKTAVNTDEQFYEAINELLKPANLGIIVKDKSTLKEAALKLKSNLNPDEVRIVTALESGNKVIDGKIDALSKIDRCIKTLSDSVKGIKSDKENLKNLSIAKFLEEAEKVLSVHESEDCPLCMHNIKRDELIEQVRHRIETLKELRERLRKVTDERDDCLVELRDFYGPLKSEIKRFSDLSLQNVDINPCLSSLNEIEDLGKYLNGDVLSLDEGKIIFNPDMFQKALSNLKDQTNELLSKKKVADPSQRMELFATIEVSELAFKKILDLGKQKAILECQWNTLEEIYSLFVSRQKSEMETFLKTMSDQINALYLFMNEGEKVDGIELVTVNNTDGEFAGIQIQHKFHGKEVNTPKKFLSESHINCIGLSIFLSTVRLLNQNAKFIVLDDVISSFDKTHRIRFGQLLFQKFSDYQIIILTHEPEWFDFMANQVKGKGWKIHTSKWSAEHGIFLDLPKGDLQAQIDAKIEANDENGLGNLVRRYAERILKDLCINLKAELPYRSNESNENRTVDELLNYLRSRLKSKSNLANSDSLTSLSGMQFLSNRTSHDSPYRENISDLKAAYKIVNDFRDLFLCDDSTCSKWVSLENSNKSKKVISCRCGKKEIVWRG